MYILLFFHVLVFIAAAFSFVYICFNEILLTTTGWIFLSFFVAGFSIINAIAIFYKITNKYPLNDISNYFVNNVNLLCENNKVDKNNKTITFTKTDGVWHCSKGNYSIKLNLKGYLFEKSYLISYVVRNLRYPIITNKQPLKYLFKQKYFIKENLNVNLILIDGEKTSVVQIVKNGVSQYKRLAKLVTEAPFHYSLLFARTGKELDNFTTIINEKTYKNYKDIRNNSSF